MHRPDHSIGEALQEGVIASVDYSAATCTVQLGDLVTGDLPWLTGRAGAVRIWSPPTVGEGCLVAAPEGDLANGLVLLGTWSNANPAPSASPDLTLIAFRDGAALSYDHAAHALAVILPGGGSALIDAPAGITINGPVSIDGDVTISGDVTAAGDVTADSVSLKQHRHSAVQPGGGQSGPPAP